MKYISLNGQNIVSEVCNHGLGRCHSWFDFNVTEQFFNIYIYQNKAQAYLLEDKQTVVYLMWVFYYVAINQSRFIITQVVWSYQLDFDTTVKSHYSMCGFIVLLWNYVLLFYHKSLWYNPHLMGNQWRLLDRHTLAEEQRCVVFTADQFWITVLTTKWKLRHTHSSLHLMCNQPVYDIKTSW